MAKNNSRAARRSTPTKKKQSKKPQKKHGSLLLKIFLGVAIAGVAALLIGAGTFFWYAKSAPKLNDQKLGATVSSRLFAANGELLDDLGAEKRLEANADEIPQVLEDAIVSVEDRRFYEHHGVDPIRILGSAFSNFKSHGANGLQGGSTLTQQLIKLSYFSTKSSDQTLKRKAQEAWMSVKLERKKSKEEILTYYINKVYMANGLYGMKTAADIYYGKPLSELNLAETALLAGMPQAPSAYDPYTHPAEAKERRDIVLYTMLENHKITESEYQEAKAAPVETGLRTELPQEDNEQKIIDNYEKEVIAEVKEKTGKNVFTDGLEIYTNLDMDAQNQLYEIVNSDQYITYPDPEFQVAATLMDTKTGKVTAQIGGRNIPDDVQFGKNLAVNTARDFGSTVKPITDYGPAFEYLKKSTGATIVDAPYEYKGTTTAVQNWDHRYMGTMTLRQALYESRNVPAVKLFEEVGSEKVSEFLKKLDIEYQSIQQSNAISSNTETQEGTKYGVSSLKMAAAYSAFANGGTYYKPQYISKIIYPDGSEESYEPEGQKAMEPYTAYMITDILKDVISQGTGTNAQISGLIQAGKTGTSNYTDEELEKLPVQDNVSPDVMFSGYTPYYSLSVWTGYNDRMTPITSASNMIASDVYRELMQFIATSVPNEDWEMPDDVLRVGNELYVKGQNGTPTAPSSSAAPSYSQQHTPRYTTPSQTTPSSSYTPPASTTPSQTAEVPTTPSASTPASSTPEPVTPPASSTPESVTPPASSETPPATGESTPPVTPPVEENNE